VQSIDMQVKTAVNPPSRNWVAT